ncbi:MAG: succinate dehydrogenase, hydrophobic membrane anchor protein [Maricaulaceae bacterium]
MATSDLRTPLSRARGLGSAKHGTEHFIKQRVSAIALAILVPWFLISLIGAMEGGYLGAIAWIGAPVNAVLLVLLLTAAFFHMRLGLQVVVEDYISSHVGRAAALIANTFFAAALWVASVLAVVKISIGG